MKNTLNSNKNLQRYYKMKILRQTLKLNISITKHQKLHQITPKCTIFHTDYKIHIKNKLLYQFHTKTATESSHFQYNSYFQPPISRTIKVDNFYLSLNVQAITVWG